VRTYRAFRGPRLVTVAHVAGGAEGKVDVVAAGANPVVLTPPACSPVPTRKQIHSDAALSGMNEKGISYGAE
jgi:hypothetical protein